MSMRHILMKMKCSRYINKTKAHTIYGSLKSQHYKLSNLKSQTIWNTKTFIQRKSQKNKTHKPNGYEIYQTAKLRTKTSPMRLNHDSKYIRQQKQPAPINQTQQFKETHVRTKQRAQTQHKTHKMKKYTCKHVK